MPSRDCYWPSERGDGILSIVRYGSSNSPAVGTMNPGDRLFESIGCSDRSRR